MGQNFIQFTGYAIACVFFTDFYRIGEQGVDELVAGNGFGCLCFCEWNETLFQFFNPVALFGVKMKVSC